MSNKKDKIIGMCNRCGASLTNGHSCPKWIEPMTTDIANSGLLPCPFCGENPVKFQLESGTWVIECRGGKCTFKPSSLYSYEIEERAIEAWNKREKFSPDWDNYQQGRKDALQEAADTGWFTIIHINSQDKESLMVCHVKVESGELLREIKSFGFVGKYVVLPGKIGKLLPEELATA